MILPKWYYVIFGYDLVSNEHALQVYDPLNGEKLQKTEKNTLFQTTWTFRFHELHLNLASYQTEFTSLRGKFGGARWLPNFYFPLNPDIPTALR